VRPSRTQEHAHAQRHGDDDSSGGSGGSDGCDGDGGGGGGGGGGGAGGDGDDGGAVAGDLALELSVPASLNCHLRDYQREGVHFLYRLWAAGKGGILADDMGLGKTLQTIAFMAAILKSPATRDAAGNPPPPVLIVCPTSVIENWERELKQWGAHLPHGGFAVERVHGAGGAAAWGRVVYPDTTAPVEVVLTAYDYFRIGIAEFAKMRWSACIFDEAHKLKNHRAKLYEAACQLPQTRRFGLTGTAMQNSYDELFNLMDWACPGCLGEKKPFKLFYCRTMQQAQRFDVDERTLGLGRQRADALSRLLKKYLLKRTKAKVLAGQLPVKQDNVVFCELSPLQTRVYRRLIESADFQVLNPKP
jgi:SNF2 family DNA or RNA helicase